MPSFDFVKDDCAVESAVLGKRGYNLSSTQAMMLFHVKPTEKKFSELTESAAMGFSMMCVMLQAVYTTGEKEFRTIVFSIFYASCWHKKAPIRHKRWNNMIFHPVHYKDKGLQSLGLFKTFRGGIRFQIINITKCESLRIEQELMKFPCQPKISSKFTISYRAKTLA